GYADRAYPGLIRGILYAAGDYNQDLFARAILAEVGSTYNRLQEAENGARLFANVLASMLADIRISPDMPDPNARGAQRFASRRGWQGVGILLALVVSGFAIYLIVNEEGYQRVVALFDTLGDSWNRLRRQLRRRA
ncbi:MAG: stage II sporulation protein P, partial [Bacillota bacterium]